MSKIQHDSATPAHGQQVITAVAFIHRLVDGEQRVFLPKRADTKVFLPSLFGMVGGHIDFGEDIVAGLKREIKEELGVDSEIGDPFACFTYLNNIKGSHSVEVVYFGKFIGSLDDIRLNPEDHSTCEWFSRKDVEERKAEIVPPVSSTDVTDNSEDDPEYEALLKGFDLLEGKSIDFGK